MTNAERRTDDRAGYPPPALTAAVFAIIAVVFAAWAVVVIGETTARAITSYTAIEANVVDERIDERVIADRPGGSRSAPYRTVTVELADGSRVDLVSDELEVGVTATVYRDDAGEVFETPPQRPGLLEWALCAALVGAAVLLAVASLRIVVRSGARARAA